MTIIIPQGADFSGAAGFTRFDPPIADASACFWFGLDDPYCWKNFGTAGGEATVTGAPAKQDAMFRRFDRDNSIILPITRTTDMTVFSVIRDAAIMPIGVYTDPYGMILSNERQAPGAVTGGFTFVGSISATTLTVTSTTKPLTPSVGITAAGVSGGTRITAQLTSTEPGGALGGAGTYSVNNSQTVSSTTMTATESGRRGFTLMRNYSSSGPVISLGSYGSTAAGANASGIITQADSTTVPRLIVSTEKVNPSNASWNHKIRRITPTAATTGPTTNGAVVAPTAGVQPDEANFPLRVGRTQRADATWGAPIEQAFLMVVPRDLPTEEQDDAVIKIKKRFTALGVTI